MKIWKLNELVRANFIYKIIPFKNITAPYYNYTITYFPYKSLVV